MILRRGKQDSLQLWLRSKRKHGEVLHVKNEGGSETLSSKRKSKEERRHKEKHWVAEAEAKWPNLKGCLKKNVVSFHGGMSQRPKATLWETQRESFKIWRSPNPIS